MLFRSAPLLAGSVLKADILWRVTGLAVAFAIALAYFGLHAVFSRWLGAEGTGASPSMGLVMWVLGCFTLLFVVQGAVRAQPKGALARGLYPWLFAGLYLDELFTRLTFRLWPARAPTTPGTLAKPATLANAQPSGDLS